MENSHIPVHSDKSCLHRRMEKGQWYWTDKAIYRHVPKIGFVGAVVYGFLASFADANQTCYPSQRHIANVLGCSRSTINRAIKTLERHGLILIDKTTRYPQVYHLLKVSH